MRGVRGVRGVRGARGARGVGERNSSKWHTMHNVGGVRVRVRVKVKVAHHAEGP